MPKSALVLVLVLAIVVVLDIRWQPGKETADGSLTAFDHENLDVDRLAAQFSGWVAETGWAVRAALA